MYQQYEEQESVWILFDLEEPGAEEDMRRTFEAFRTRVEVMGLDEEHPILVIRPGGATRAVKS